MEDLIFKNPKSKTLRKYSKTSIEVQLEEAAWWGVFLSNHDIYYLHVKLYSYICIFLLMLPEVILLVYDFDIMIIVLG